VSDVRTGRRADLEDRRAFLEASLADAAREHEAGDLSDEDYRVLRLRDEQRLDEVSTQLALADATPAETNGHAATDTAGDRRPKGGRSRRPRVLGLAGAALVAIGAVVLVVHLTSSRLPGQTATGSVQLSKAQRINQELEQADAMLAANDVPDAVNLYTEVLQQDPRDPPALAQLGWLTYEGGVESSDAKAEATGRSLVQRAVAADPKFGPAHLYDGVILINTDDDAAGAVAQFRLFLAEHPSKQNLQNGAPFIRKAYTEDHQPVPAVVPASP
jgi:hypothetical protein